MNRIMIVILDSNESILEFMDDSDASIEITDTYGGLVKNFVG